VLADAACADVLAPRRSAQAMEEWTRLEYIKEIGKTHLRILEGVNSFMQLTALVARLCRLSITEPFDK